jgi:hypothetical protein
MFRLPLAPLSLAAAIALSGAASAQVTASYTLGDPGCNGSPLSACVTLNDVNPVLQVSSLPNEYAYPVVNSTSIAIQIVCFQVWTRSNSGSTTEVGNTAIYLDASGPGALALTAPAATSVAQGTITVGPTPNWYATTIVPPVVLLPGEVCWLGVDAYSRIAPPMHDSTGVNGPAANFWRRTGTNWAASGSVFRPIYRVICASDFPTTPYVTASNPPRLGQSITLTLGGGQPQTLGFFIFSTDNTNWYGLPTPVDLAAFGAPNCFVNCAWQDVFTLGLDAQGRASLSGTIPNFAAFNGVRFYNQGLVLAPGTNLLNLIVSNLGTAVMGN